MASRDTDRHLATLTQNRRVRINLPDNHHNREDKRCRAYVFDNLLKPSRPCINLGTQNTKDSFGFFTVHVTGREKEMTNKQKTQTQQLNNTLNEYSPPLFTNRQCSQVTDLL